MKATQRKEVDMEPLTKARTMGIIFGKEAMRKALTLPKAIAYSGEFLGEANRYAVSETREQAWQWAWRVYGVDAMGADWADAFRTELSL